MNKLTELDLQNALDECELIRFKTHGDWLAGMVKRLNMILTKNANEPKVTLKPIPTVKKITIIQTGNNIEPASECKS